MKRRLWKTFIHCKISFEIKVCSQAASFEKILQNIVVLLFSIVYRMGDLKFCIGHPGSSVVENFETRSMEPLKPRMIFQGKSSLSNDDNNSFCSISEVLFC